MTMNMNIIIVVDLWHLNKVLDMKISINLCEIPKNLISLLVKHRSFLLLLLLKFVFDSELIKVLRPGEYEKDTYLLNDEEKKQQIPELKQAGNNLYNAGEYEQAAQKYGQALQFFEDLMLK